MTFDLNVVIKEPFPFNVNLLYTLIYLYASSFDGIYISIYITYNVFAMRLFFFRCLRKMCMFGFEEKTRKRPWICIEEKERDRERE